MEPSKRLKRVQACRATNLTCCILVALQLVSITTIQISILTKKLPILEQGCFIFHLFQFHVSDRNDASKYGVLEDYVFDEDCTFFTKVVRVYADKEDSEDFSKFQVCNLKCVLE